MVQSRENEDARGSAFLYLILRQEGLDRLYSALVFSELGGACSPPQFWFNSLDHENHIRSRMTTDSRGRAIRFTLQLETIIDDDWTPVVRYDNAYGRAHIDSIDPGGVTCEKVWLEHWEPFNNAFTPADNELKATWQVHRSRFLTQMKKR